MKTPFRFALTALFARWVFLVLATIGTISAASDAAAQQTQARSSEGYAICGGTDRNGKILPSCGLTSATKTGKAVATCPQGSFRDGESCYSCPSGYPRTGFPVTGDKACSKEIRAEYKRATRIGGHKACPAGSFKDGRNGGECWACPSGFGRTMASVTDWNACGKAFARERKAEFIDRVCPEGTIVDINGSCYTCPEGFRRTAAAVTAHNACFRNEHFVKAASHGALSCKAGEHFDFIDGGTCWKCPLASVRSVFHVKSNKACEYTTMRWESAKRTPNGLFGLWGSYEVVAQVIKERTRIDAAIDKFISDGNLNKAKGDVIRAGAWEVIQTEPETSLILKAAVYDHVFDLIKNGAKTKAEWDLLDYIATYIQQTRLLAANEMNAMWQSWQGKIIALGKRHSGTNLVSTQYNGIRPPNMEDLVAEIMTAMAPGSAIVMASIGASAGQAASTGIANFTASIAKTLMPYRYAKEFAEGTKLLKAGLAGGKSALAAGGVGVGAIAAPLVMLTASTIVFTIAADIAADNAKQEAIVHDALITARKKVNLSRLVLTDNGRTEVATNWVLMTQESIKPHAAKWAHLMSGGAAPQGGIAGIIAAGIPNNIKLPEIVLDDGNTVVNATAATANKSTKWVKIGGKATDVAVGSDGTVYVIGVKKISAKGGYEIFKRAKTDRKWTKIKGAATRVAVMGTQAWVVTLDGQIFSEAGPNKWQKIPGPAAQDIGASAKGVWIVDTNNKIHKREGTAWKSVPGFATRIDIDQDGRPWALSRKDTIFVHDNREKWQKIPGNAIDVAADIPGATVAIGKHGKTFVYNMGKKNWDTISSDKTAIAVGAGGGQVWRLTKTNDIYHQQ